MGAADDRNDSPTGMPFKETPRRQKETRKEHICTEKHDLGHEDLPEVMRQDGKSGSELTTRAIKGLAEIL